MKTSSATKIYGWLSGRTALCIVLLAACSASRSHLSAAIPGQSNAAITNYAEALHEWFPTPRQVTCCIFPMTGFVRPQGECVDNAGDVFTADNGASNIADYAHGGTSPIAVLNDPRYVPLSLRHRSNVGSRELLNPRTSNPSSRPVALREFGGKNATSFERTQ